MATKLEMLLESIDPSRTLEKTSAAVDRAMNSLSTGKGRIDTWDEYERSIADFFQHVESVVLRIAPGGPDDRTFYSSRCVALLNKAYGASGYKTAFDMVRTGKDGGLYRVLKTVADLMAENYAQNEIYARISNYWEGLSLDEKLAAPDEYLLKYGYLLPEEWTKGSAPRVRAFFVKVLEQHPAMIRRMRRIGR
jgi:hypothetical protein